jgi:hypothetical protein
MDVRMHQLADLGVILGAVGNDAGVGLERHGGSQLGRPRLPRFWLGIHTKSFRNTRRMR